MVEFSLTAPILFLIVFSGIEFSRANMIRNTCENAAYEGARRGIVSGATADDCRTRAQETLDMIGLTDSTITVTPSSISSGTTDVTVSITVPMNAANGYVTPNFFLGSSITRSCTLQTEIRE